MPISPFAVPSYARFPVHRHHPSSVIHLPHSAQPGCRFDRNRHRHPSAAACALDAEGGGGSSVKLAPSPNLPPVSPPLHPYPIPRSLTHSFALIRMVKLQKKPQRVFHFVTDGVCRCTCFCIVVCGFSAFPLKDTSPFNWMRPNKLSLHVQTAHRIGKWGGGGIPFHYRIRR